MQNSLLKNFSHTRQRQGQEGFLVKISHKYQIAILDYTEYRPDVLSEGPVTRALSRPCLPSTLLLWAWWRCSGLGIGKQVS